MLSSWKLLLFRGIIHLLFSPEFYVGASSLPSAELQALHDVAAVLNKTDWNYNLDPCYGWTDPILPTENNVTCDCNIPNVDGCHVVAIVLKSQNLSGTLPKNLTGLPYLRIIDLAKNYLHGSIPSQWGSLKLFKISLLGNRLTGSIPQEIGNISTLSALNVQDNQFSGVIPSELGNLSNLQSLLLTSNNFSGKLPETLGRLTNLTDLRIGNNPFTGPIPSFLQNLTNLAKLVIQGNNFSGPIPPGIGLLVKMHDMRICDLVGGIESKFPLLNNLNNLHVLILRNCNLVGPLPNFWDNLSNLHLQIDLSYNKLTGEFPSTFVGKAPSITRTYLTNNMFSGEIPSYAYETVNYLDLSYNNFSTATTPCQLRTVNLFASSSTNNVSKVVSCLQGYKCHPKKFYSMNINCGGPAIKIGNVAYDEDLDPGGPSNFYQSKKNWAYSNTGDFIDTNNPMDSYLQSNTTPLSPNASSLYKTARISPLSLTYYAFCIMNGDYTVHLHFAEIKFTDDRSYMSLGSRFFNVFIQGNLVLENFNIEHEAGGIGIPIIKNFTTHVASNTLEIRFYWAGKGTIDIPMKGVWGPIISAITVSPNFPIPSEHNSLPTPALIGIAIGATVFIFLLLGLIWLAWLKRKTALEGDIEKLKVHTGWFTLSQIKEATMDFDYTNKLGEGGFGSVYKGLLPDGTVIAVKQLSSVSKQGNREFINEIGMISALQHPNLVKLHGCCIEGAQLFLVYEYMQNNSLARALYGREEHQLDIDWPTRLRICIGIARGLAYLHEESMVKVVHRDIKTSNVLLDKDLNPKISDFGLAKLNEDDNTSIHTRIAGTRGYMAPEYAMHGVLTSKADVYSFGVVLLEIVSGKSVTFFRTHEEDLLYLLDWALVLNRKGKLLELIDQRLGLEYNPDEVISVINVAFLCTNVSPVVRPPMSSVVKMLQGTTAVQPRRPVVPPPIHSTDHQKTRGFDSVVSATTTSQSFYLESDSFDSKAFLSS